MIRLLLAFAAGTAFGQDAAMIASVERLRYQPLAEQARVQGDVHLRGGLDGITVLSGHPLLVAGARENFIQLAKIAGHDIVAVYHFTLAEPVSRNVTVTEKKGDAFDRLILRALRLKTKRTILE